MFEMAEQKAANSVKDTLGDFRERHYYARV